jgi:hypothetical protein
VDLYFQAAYSHLSEDEPGIYLYSCRASRHCAKTDELVIGGEMNGVFVSLEKGASISCSGTVTLRLVANQPLHPTTSGGLTAAVVAGERRR